jgi:hypothetical protein
MTAPTASISAAASISRSPPRRASNRAARASMAAATGYAWLRSNSVSTACAATSRVSPSPNAPISSECERTVERMRVDLRGGGRLPFEGTFCPPQGPCTLSECGITACYGRALFGRPIAYPNTAKITERTIVPIE